MCAKVVTQLRARMPHHRAVPSRTQGEPTLFDEEDTTEEVATHGPWTRPDVQKKYGKLETWTRPPHPTTPPPHYRPVDMTDRCHIHRPILTTGPFYLNRTRLDDGKAGASIVVGETRILSRVLGQESYRSEICGLYLITQLHAPRQAAKLDNQAVTKVAATEPTREESDVDLKTPLANTMRHKQLRAKWIKGHCKDWEVKNKEDKQVIRYNNITDGLAKQAANLAPQDIVFTSSASIHIAGAKRQHRLENGL